MRPHPWYDECISYLVTQYHMKSERAAASDVLVLFMSSHSVKNTARWSNRVLDRVQERNDVVPASSCLIEECEPPTIISH